MAYIVTKCPDCSGVVEYSIWNEHGYCHTCALKLPKDVFWELYQAQKDKKINESNPRDCCGIRK